MIVVKKKVEVNLSRSNEGYRPPNMYRNKERRFATRGNDECFTCKRVGHYTNEYRWNLGLFEKRAIPVLIALIKNKYNNNVNKSNSYTKRDNHGQR